MKSLGVGVGGVFLCQAPELSRHLKSSFPREFISLWRYTWLFQSLSFPNHFLPESGQICHLLWEPGLKLALGVRVGGAPQAFSLSGKEGLQTLVDCALSPPML